MKSIYTTFISLLFLPVLLRSQQLPYTSLFNETWDVWNPANTSLDNKFYTDVFFRQQWLGFGSGAPSTGYIGLKYPFVNMNMAAGGNLVFDKTGPVRKIGINANYAYKIYGALGEDSQLSLGVTGGFTNFGLNTESLVVNVEEDALLAGGSQSKFFPSVGGGIYFISNNDERRATHAFDLGFSVLSAIKSNLLLTNANLQTEIHYVFNMGTKFYGESGIFYPTFLINYVSPEIMDLMIGAKYEYEKSFWAGLGYSNVNELSIQGGFIINEFGGRDTRLRIGALGNVAITDRVKQFGPGFEILLRYEFDMD
jgi:type IX secretion system PorP/SprF family membrane protein